ncbi:MAG: mechanosensitive ion channel family protein [Halioglobus sp.]|nr:mechanosensitive ion channel family protein [Halioglobus sp.]
MPSGCGYFRAHLVLLGLSCLLCAPPAAAQEAPVQQDASMREVLEAEQVAQQLAQEKVAAQSRGEAVEQTPLTAVLRLRAAMNAGDYATAGSFLDLRFLPEDVKAYTPEQLIRALGYVWSQQNIVDLTTLSDDPEGHRDDGLPSYRDQVGSVTISTGTIPIYLQRVPDGRGGRQWKLSNATVARIPQMWRELGYSPVATYLSEMLPDFRVLGMDNWQVVATVLFLLIAWPLATLASYLLMWLALRVPNRFPLGIQHFFRRPMRFFLFVMIARSLVDQLGLSLTARILLQSSGVTYIAATVLVLGLLSLLRDYQIRKMQHAGNTQYVALLKPFTTIVKVLVITGIALSWAHDAGYDMTTLLAGLGVGSLAVALAAQKTLENVIGAVTLYTARPVSVGDFCRFGDISGTVEEIGLRSTLIRTLDRTLVVIPNSVFSSTEIENYSNRDRIRYLRQFRLQLPDAERLRFVLGQLRKLFLAHPRVFQDTVSIRFTDIQDDNAILRVDAGVDTTDFRDFLAVAEDLNLRVVETVQEAGGVFTGPSQLVQLHQSGRESEEHAARREQAFGEWRAQERLPFPDYSDAEMAQLKGTLDYPAGNTPR